MQFIWLFQGIISAIILLSVTLTTSIWILATTSLWLFVIFVLKYNKEYCMLQTQIKNIS